MRIGVSLACCPHRCLVLPQHTFCDATAHLSCRHTRDRSCPSIHHPSSSIHQHPSACIMHQASRSMHPLSSIVGVSTNLCFFHRFWKCQGCLRNDRASGKRPPRGFPGRTGPPEGRICTFFLKLLFSDRKKVPDPLPGLFLVPTQ